MIHLAGVNRAESRRGGRARQRAARRGTSATRPRRPSGARRLRQLRAVRRSTTPTGAASGEAADARSAGAAGARFADVVLPNLFGEHGRPAYNSFVATFCHEVAHGRQPEVTERPADPAAARPGRRAGARRGRAGAGRPRRARRGRAARRRRGAATCCSGFHALYAERGEVPDLSDRVRGRPVQHLPLVPSSPSMFPDLPARSTRDPRGDLFETVACARRHRPGLRVDHRARATRAATTTTCTRSSGSSWCRARPRSRCAGSSRRGRDVPALGRPAGRSWTCRRCGCTTSATSATTTS